MFDRTDGTPLFPIEYRKYPPSTLPGEMAADTQPMPLKPAPYARQRLTEDMLTNRTPEAHAFALDAFRKFRSEGQFVPPGLGLDTAHLPLTSRPAAQWGGSALDPETGVIYINANDIAWTANMVENRAAGASGPDKNTSGAARASPWRCARRSAAADSRG